ncbi:MAG TPA: hypothetical protein VMV29_08480 [Ktedonobacterales bacterium]|nr:hypothetical protein [Ktedonobacterales bacterium]
MVQSEKSNARAGASRQSAPQPETPETLLAALRQGGAMMAQAQATLAHAGSPDGQPRRSLLRAAVTSALADDLRPADHTLARWLLTQEIAAHEAAGQGGGETLFTLVAIVARFGQPDDASLIWRARQATPETRAGVDVEQIVRAGVDRVRLYLSRRAKQGKAGGAIESARSSQLAREGARQANLALAWIDEGQASGAFDDLPAYFAWSDEHYGLRVVGPT